jgi:hypothetical protein
MPIVAASAPANVIAHVVALHVGLEAGIAAEIEGRIDLHLDAGVVRRVTMMFGCPCRYSESVRSVRH